MKEAVTKVIDTLTQQDFHGAFWKLLERYKFIAAEGDYLEGCYVLTFDPAPKNAIPRWCTGRKWHIPMASNRKRSRERIKVYNMGQGEGPTVLIQTDAPEESDLWTAWQLFPLDDD